MKILLSFLMLFVFGFSNELSKSTSPYLLQHKDNPVDWMEWSDRAFKKAKDENKLIFLSIGYSTCHWCHEMARQSFSQKDVADILNKNFVSIKVDKERLSYIDNYYQEGYRIVNNRAGGWPLTVILLPNKKPVYFGTYMPKDALIELLKKVASTKRDKLESIANDIEKAINLYKNSKVKEVKLSNNLLNKAFIGYKKMYDFKNKGFSKAPKFPQANSINALLNIYLIEDNKEALKMATDMLDAMAKGGIYDQIDGGFFRYSVDSKWTIPHFEKMLYTNAELISVYSKAYKITKKKLYAKVVRESIKEIDRRFFHQGLYYSASNADSKDENGNEREGYYFVFDYNEALDYLTKHGISKLRAQEVLKHFGIKDMGNFEGGEYSNPTLKKYDTKYERERHLLSELRAKREYPFIDKKINTAWNALYIKAKIDAGVVDSTFTKEAISSLNKLLEIMQNKNGELYHQTLLPNKPTQKGLLEDYAFIGNALFSAYEATLDDKYLNNFEKVVAISVNKFYKGSKWLQSTDKEFKVKATIDDGSYKSPLATNLGNILKMVLFGGDYKLLNIVEQSIKNNSMAINNYPQYYPSALNVATMLNRGLYIIKGPKIGLIKEKLNDIKYPFVYKKAINSKSSKEYQLCGLKSCYASDISIDKVKNKLKDLIKGK